MVQLGAHMSIAGGYYKAVEAAAEYSMDVVQLFTKNNNQWAAKPITDSDCTLFRESRERTGVSRPLSHSSYLINLASPKEELWKKSIDSMVVEWQRAEQLGLDGVVMHPGSYVESTPEAGLERIASSNRQCQTSTTSASRHERADLRQLLVTQNDFTFLTRSTMEKQPREGRIEYLQHFRRNPY